MLLTYVERASRKDCLRVAEALIRKYPFLKEPHSWQHFIYNKCQNINRKPSGSSSGPPVKRPRLIPTIHRYPTIENGEDEASYERNLASLNKELKEQRPATSKLKECMVRTFAHRRNWIVSSAITAHEVWTKFPLLKKASYVSDEFERIMKKPLANEFADLSKWLKATLEYALSTSTRSTGLRYALRDIQPDPAPNEERSTTDVHEYDELTALRCLGEFLIIKTRAGNKARTNTVCDIPFVLNICCSGTPPSDCVDHANNLPHIVKLCNVDQELPPQYFIALEQELIIECKSSLCEAVYLLLAVHYVYNVVYHPRALHFFNFIEEKVLQLQTQKKFNANYESTVTGIESFLDN